MGVLFSAANLLSLSRVVMAGVLWMLGPWPAAWLALLGLAALTDMLDGYVARRTRRLHRLPQHGAAVEEMGAWLDPVCDKIFVVSLLARLWWLGSLDAQALVLLTAREWLLAPLLLLAWSVPAVQRIRIPYRARPLGKATTVAQFAAVITLLVHPGWMTAMLWLCAGLGATAVTDYATRAFRQWQATPRA